MLSASPESGEVKEGQTVCDWPMTRTVVCAINTTVIKGHTATTATPGLGE